MTRTGRVGQATPRVVSFAAVCGAARCDCAAAAHDRNVQQANTAALVRFVHARNYAITRQNLATTIIPFRRAGYRV